MAERVPVLVIDDDEQLLELVQYQLRLVGFEVFTASDGAKGVKLAKKRRPAVILLDTTMPGMDGLEVLSELKHDEKTEHIPVFMLTGRTMMGDIERAFDVGADDYISKPVEMRELGKIIRRKLDRTLERRQSAGLPGRQ